MISQFECIPISSKDVKNANVKDPVLSKVYDAVIIGWTDVQDKELILFKDVRHGDVLFFSAFEQKSWKNYMTVIWVSTRYIDQMSADLLLQP